MLPGTDELGVLGKTVFLEQSQRGFIVREAVRA
jgi:hypothetical protein